MMYQDTIKQVQQYLEMVKHSGGDVIYRVSETNFTEGNVGGKTVCCEVSDSAPKEVFHSLRATVNACVQCSELATFRTHVVFGSGNISANLVFVGEAPGYEEDRRALPFVGKAGQLLTKIIGSIGLSREDVYICNVLKCRPPRNRNPLPAEIANCKPYLIRQLDMIRPKIICALGMFAAQTLLETNASISSLRGKLYDYRGAKLICTFHPAYLLRNPQDKRHVWEDMKRIRTELAEA